jgi:hypothetical protein
MGEETRPLVRQVPRSAFDVRIAFVSLQPAGYSGIMTGMSTDHTEQLILQGTSEVEMDLLRGLLEDAGVETFHVPSAASALQGRVSGIRRAIRVADRDNAAAVLASAGFRLEDFVAPASAYNLDEPYHSLVAPGARSRTLVTVGLALLALAMLVLIAYLSTK